MGDLEQFIHKWFPDTEEWTNIGKFILESGIQFTDEENPKWLTGYTNIGRSVKPHHKDEYIRYMEESMFVLHDVIHQIFTLDTECSEEVYVKRQIYGELFTFYLTEFEVPKYLEDKYQPYIEKRGCYNLMSAVIKTHEDGNLIDHMWNVFIGNKGDGYFKETLRKMKSETLFKKYQKMFQEDLVNSRKNYTFVPDVKSYCMVGISSQNHIDFYQAVQKGVIKNIKRDFNVKLPKEWL